MNDAAYLNTIVPAICKGIYRQQLKGTETHEVDIYDSPLDKFTGSVYCSIIYQPGGRNGYRAGDRVAVLIQFTFRNDRFEDVAPGSSKQIIGMIDERSIANLRLEHPVTERDSDRIGLINDKSGAGFVADDFGHAFVSSGGSVYSVYRAFGYGVYENSHSVYAENHHRMIIGNEVVPSREHMGMYSGADQQDQQTHTSPDDFLLVYRRFISQSKNIKNWVSTCEGAFAPWVGANNTYEDVKKGRESLFTKIINYGDSRLTIEAGAPGDEFFKFRIDKVIKNESRIADNPGATPAVVSNRFKIVVSDAGAMDIYAGANDTKKAAMHLKIDADGNLSIYAKKNITISHSSGDEKTNAIVMDPSKGIDVFAKKGFRVNGQPVVVEKFIKWMDENKMNLCQVTAIGGPAPIHPLALPTFTTGVTSPESAAGFLSAESGQPAQGLIDEPDQHSSV